MGAIREWRATPGRARRSVVEVGLTSEVSRRGRRGGCFPGNDTEFPGLASDPTRPDPTLTSEPNFHILSPVRPPFGPSSHWRVLSRRVGRFHILWLCKVNIWELSTVQSISRDQAQALSKVVETDHQYSKPSDQLDSKLLRL